MIQSLGPDLLDDDADLDEAVARLRALGDVALGDALLNQRAVAGIGNVFKSEVCFAARLSPFDAGVALDEATLRRVLEIARQQLRANVPEAGDGGADDVDGAAAHDRTCTSGAGAVGLWPGGRAVPSMRDADCDASSTGSDARVTYYCPACQRSAAELKFRPTTDRT